ncbi:hypothetical protein EVC12_054 [Rhizobium phage RHph_I42]|nr:hypothetical protein EVC12_054 [Rhizobium phage RHph_I42]
MSMSTVYDKHTADGMLPVGSGEHFCVLEFVADDTSPSFYQNVSKFHVFTSQQRLEEWLSETRGSNYIVLAARRIGVKTRAVIEFE